MMMVIIPVSDPLHKWHECWRNKAGEYARLVQTPPSLESGEDHHADDYDVDADADGKDDEDDDYADGVEDGDDVGGYGEDDADVDASIMDDDGDGRPASRLKLGALQS